MNDSSPREIELTPDLLDYAKAVAIKEAEKNCPKHVNFDDIVQEVWLKLLSKPPKHDPARGASVKTLLYTIVQRIVLKYVARQCWHASRYKQVVERKPDVAEGPIGKLSEPRAGTVAARERMVGQMEAEAADDGSPQRETVERRPAKLTTKGLTTDDILQFVDSEESRALCRLVIECEGNVSEAARRMGFSEGTVRYRLKLLAPKLLTAGFDPFNTRSLDDDRD